MVKKMKGSLKSRSRRITGSCNLNHHSLQQIRTIINGKEEKLIIIIIMVVLSPMEISSTTTTTADRIITIRTNKKTWRRISRTALKTTAVISVITKQYEIVKLHLKLISKLALKFMLRVKEITNQIRFKLIILLRAIIILLAWYNPMTRVIQSWKHSPHISNSFPQ